MKSLPSSLSRRLFVALVAILLLAACAGPLTAPPPAKGTFVVVHGGWGGAYAWRPCEAALRAAGYTVYRPTLVGTGDTVHLASPTIGLETHIQQIVNLILYEDLHDILLTGYSYSGMVVTGVVDRVPDRIRKVILIDAFLPNDGESTLSFVNEMRSPMMQALLKEIKASEDSGLVPAFWEKPQATPPKQDPQPYKTLADKIVLWSPAAKGVPGAFIQFVPPGVQPSEADFGRSAERARSRGWPVVVLAGDHGSPFHSPEPIVRELLRFASTE